MRIATCEKGGRSYRRRRRGEKGAGLPGTGISLLLGVLLLIVASPLAMLAPVNNAAAAPAAETDGATDLRGQASRGYRVFATREGLVGGYTSNGHLITPWDYFVSLPACTSMSCPGASPGRSGFTNCGSLCYVKVTNPATGACRTEPVIEVGPWFTVDDWWNPADVRFLNKLPSNRQILPQGYPGAQAAWEGKNVGYGWGSNGIGGSDYYSSVGNQAAIDLADGTYWSLGIGGVVGNWVDVEMLWQTGENPSAAAASCGHQLGKGGGAIPKWTPTPTTPTPTIPLITWGTARVTGTGGSGLNCRTAPSGSGTVIAVLAEGATVTLRGPAVSGWYPVICAGQAGYASASYLTTTTTPTPTMTPTRTTTATASPTVTGTPTSTTTVSPTATGTATGTPTSTATTTPASLTPSPTGTTTSTTTATETKTVVPTTETPSPTASTTATATGTPTPTAPSSSPTATIRPTVTPTSGPRIWGSGTVANTGGAGVNCRVGPSTSSGVIAVLAEGAAVQLTGPASGGWHPVICSGRAGYVSAQFLRSVPYTPTPAPTVARTATTGAPSPTAIPTRTATATLTATVQASATRTATPAPSSTPARTPTGTPSLQNWGTGTVRNTGGAGVNCRTAPNTSASIIRTLAEGATVQLTGPASGGWQPVACNARQGYISAQYLGVVQFTPTPAPTRTMTATVAVGGALAPDQTVTPLPDSPTSPAATPTPSTPTSEPPTVQSTRTATSPASDLPAAPEASATEIPLPTATTAVEEAPTEMPPPTEPVLTTAYVAWTEGQGLACMAAPSWDSALLAVIPDGTEVTQYGSAVEGWQMIACGEALGYVDAAHLSPVPVAPEPTAEETPAVDEATESAPEGEEPPLDVVPQSFTFFPVAETSVFRSSPDVPQGGVSGSGLRLGGPDGGVVAITFAVSGIADGTVIEATLFVTGAGDTAGTGGSVLAVPGAYVDPGSATIASIDALGGAGAGWLDTVAPGVQTPVDVTGTVANGTITFVLVGADSGVTIASSASGSGPILVITALPAP